MTPARFTPKMVAGLLFAFLLPVQAADGVVSGWKTSDIQTDGRIEEWPVLTAFDQHVSIAAFNDTGQLHLVVAASDPPRRRQLATAGVIVWLDVNGGKKRNYGIRIPGAGFPRMERGDEVRIPPPDVAPPKVTYIELLGPGKDDRRRIEVGRSSEGSPSAASGFAAAVGVDEGTLSYELRVPLLTTLGLVPKPGRAVGLGLETPKMERGRQGGPGGGQGPGGGRGGAGGGAGGGGRGGAGGGGFGGGFGGGGGRGGPGGGRGGPGGMQGRGGARVEDLKLWTTLTLAETPM